MAYDIDDVTGLPLLKKQSLLSDVPAYTEALVQSLATILPIGLIQPFAGEFNQSSMGCWRLCDGLEVPDYPEYAALRTLLNNAHSSYKTPDLRGRAPIGMGIEGSSVNPKNYDTLLKKYGDERIPKHDHDVHDPTHNHHAVSANGSNPTNDLANWTVGNASTLGGRAPFGATGFAPTGVSVEDFSTNANYSLDGGSNNVPPSLAVNFVILAAYRSPATP